MVVVVVVCLSCRFGVIMLQYLHLCGEHRLDLGKQLYVLAHIDRVAMQVKTRKSRAGQVETARVGLSKIIFPERFFLPIDPSIEVSGLVVERCRVMTSKKLPLMLVFRTSKDFQVTGASHSPVEGRDPGGEAPSSRPTTYTVMYKNGDDLRQDQLTLQLLLIMDMLWKKDGLDLKVGASLLGCVRGGCGVLRCFVLGARLDGRVAVFCCVSAVFSAVFLHVSVVFCIMVLGCTAGPSCVCWAVCRGLAWVGGRPCDCACAWVCL